MQILERLKIVTKKKNNCTFQVIIIKCPFTKNSYNGEILGRQLVDWIRFACGNLPTTVVDWDGKENVVIEENVKGIERTSITLKF